MATQSNSGPLRPPAVTVNVPLPPDPSDPPSKEDMNRALAFKNMIIAISDVVTVPSLAASVEDVSRATTYYARVHERYQQSLGFGDMTIADVVREVRQGFGQINGRLDRIEQRMGSVVQRMGSVEQRMAVQVAAFTQFVANTVAGG
ncbi:hypothetical protein V1506DRAFT_508506 [Lipomyces tetrasporus]